MTGDVDYWDVDDIGASLNDTRGVWGACPPRNPARESTTVTNGAFGSWEFVDIGNGYRQSPVIGPSDCEKTLRFPNSGMVGAMWQANWRSEVP